MGQIRAPITGSVVKVLVSEGDSVDAGDEVAIIESMKLEIPVEADEGGRILGVLVSEGESVSEGAPLFRTD